MTDHPTREALDRYVRGGLSKAEAEAITAHLEEDLCIQCIFLARELSAEADPEIQEHWQRFVRSVTRGLKEEALSEAEGAKVEDEAMLLADRRHHVINPERGLAAGFLAEIEPRSLAARRDVIRAGQRYQLLGLAEHLCEESRKAGFRDPVRALELAELAIAVAEKLDPRLYSAKIAFEQQAMGHACRGNALRIAGDLLASEHAFQECLLLVEKGPIASPPHYEILSLLGSLRIDQCQYREARRVLRRALQGFQGFTGYEVDAAKVLIQLANVEAYDGRPREAIEIFEHAVAILQEADEPRLLAWVHHNISYCMVEAGEALEALARYEQGRSLYEEHFREPYHRLRRRWLEGRIYAGLGDFDLARDALEEVRQTAAERELPYDLAMVSLELAIVYLRRQEPARVQDLAEEMTLVFLSQDLHRHALGAMYLFRQAARTQTATIGLLEEIVTYLRRARNNPFLRFEPSARWG
jgi:tetratricopeptide (TPR) repeat protein